MLTWAVRLFQNYYDVTFKLVRKSILSFNNLWKQATTHTLWSSWYWFLVSLICGHWKLWQQTNAQACNVVPLFLCQEIVWVGLWRLLWVMICLTVCIKNKLIFVFILFRIKCMTVKQILIQSFTFPLGKICKI